MTYLQKLFYSARDDDNEDSMIAVIKKCRELGRDPDEFLTELMEWRYKRAVRKCP